MRLRGILPKIRRVTVPAVAALRMYWGTVALLTGTGFLALAAFLLLSVWRVSPWIVVLLTALSGAVLLG